ncbi:hypothetical protein TanjilG_02884 [Lupinus angustifolius]|uniref:Uncharacterized protein n=1 Tax=Lupinus angustifolius TaxID=3871 RepID=A0A4P1QNZ3_LUPAN|nr:hypothetical protein TanjilG_02884 [Lupinus angustifolius]
MKRKEDENASKNTITDSRKMRTPDVKYVSAYFNTVGGNNVVVIPKRKSNEIEMIDTHNDMKSLNSLPSELRSDAYRRKADNNTWKPPKSLFRFEPLLQEYYVYDPWRVLVVSVLLNRTTGVQHEQELRGLEAQVCDVRQLGWPRYKHEQELRGLEAQVCDVGSKYCKMDGKLDIIQRYSTTMLGSFVEERLQAAKSCMLSRLAGCHPTRFYPDAGKLCQREALSCQELHAAEASTAHTEEEGGWLKDVLATLDAHDAMVEDKLNEGQTHDLVL